jgi:hypothetical protein
MQITGGSLTLNGGGCAMLNGGGFDANTQYLAIATHQRGCVMKASVNPGGSGKKPRRSRGIHS